MATTKKQTKQNAGKYRIELIKCTGAMFEVAVVAESLINKRQGELGKTLQRAWCIIKGVQDELVKLQ